MTEIEQLRRQVTSLTRERDFYRQIAADRGAALDLVEQERDNALHDLNASR